MKFVKLRLVGFKTFVEATDVVIEPGLTGIVGPNGCGKSNLVEALRWVMGESSSKSLRATGMDDVIFSGTSRRPARDRAEVTVVLDNADRRAPPGLNDADILEVTRRIERESGSAYRVNGREVRARDVQLLFADASTGARSPALVRQGQIGELIAAKPAQRRAILEEAAGISGLHSRRHEAELRLRAAEQNLARLEDVVGEIAVRLEGLGRQARQAVRYRNLSGEIRRQEAMLLHLRWVAAKAAAAEASQTLAAAVAAVEAQGLAQAAAARDQAVAAAGLPKLRDAEAAAGAALARLRIAAEQLTVEERRARDRIVELDRRLVEAEGDAAREAAVGAEAAETLARLAAEAEDIAAEDLEAGPRAAALAERLALADAALAAAEAVLAERTRALADQAARRAALERAAREAVERAARLEREAAGAAAELAAVEAKLAAATGPAEARARLDDAAADAAAAEAALAEAEAEAQAGREAEAAARGPAAEAAAAFSALETEARTLARIIDAAGGGGRFAPVVDAIDVDRGFEAALGAALGDDLEVPVEPAAPLRWAGAAVTAADPELPAGVVALAAHVRAPAELARRLAQIGVVARADGPRLAAALASGQRLVSREGDLWRWDGLVAAAEAPSAAAERLAQKNRLSELEDEVAEARRRRDAAREAHAEAERRAAATALAERAGRDGWRSRQQAVSAAREDLARAEKSLAEVVRARDALADRAAARADDLAAAAEARDAAAAALAEAPETRGHEAELALHRAEVAERRGAVTEARAETAAESREAELRRRRAALIVGERQAAAERVAAAARRRGALSERRGDIAEERAALEGVPEEHAARRRGLVGEIAAAEAALADAADARARGEAQQAATDRTAREALETLSAAREARGRAEERLAAAGDRHAAVETAIREVLDCAAGEAAAIAGLDAAAPLPDVGAVEGRLSRLQGERERLGAVNLRAEEELAEGEARRDALIAERDDLVAAIGRLRQGIQALNREARDRLGEAFAAVDGHFRDLFAHLFDGGAGELALVESDDPLEAGLEIFARPPGKKPQTLTLLSGGEQALTTMALIFAVFLTNPAPICVLDEVDAPLDDANVERFCDLVAEMTRRTDTRFLVITHNPITMARMHRLYGVTMAERGVSQLVSVDLEGAERFLEAS